MLVIIIVIAIASVVGYTLWNHYLSSEGNGVDNRWSLPERQETKKEEPEPGPGDKELSPGPKKYVSPGTLPADEIKNKIAVIKTTKGEIRFELLPKEGPKAASNFVYLTKAGYYNGLKLHRVESWVVQGGDPNCNLNDPQQPCGAGGPGYKFEDEKVRLPYNTGIVAMANAGPNTNGSQFFIMKQNIPLPPNYTIFGRVVSGIEVVQKIVPGDVMEKIEVVSK